ncbi:hypothetical protein AVEN_121707-1 [Araneus ventricosus]|uniref:Uncharacterized protein n=1 Tax=Araneus ventricosus TaxID=182803 RepID=A0A4Y2WLL4_ARAVE|nr:hypothetical protein AVEN_121707-1 [Araneus ventricosus]
MCSPLCPRKETTQPHILKTFHQSLKVKEMERKRKGVSLSKALLLHCFRLSSHGIMTVSVLDATSGIIKGIPLPSTLLAGYVVIRPIMKTFQAGDLERALFWRGDLGIFIAVGCLKSALGGLAELEENSVRRFSKTHVHKQVTAGK